MIQNPDKWLAVLQTEQLSLLVLKEEQRLFASSDSMLAPLLRCIKDLGDDMHDAVVVDKIVGAAAAHLMVVAQVSRVITPLTSKAAHAILNQNGIPLYAEKTIPHIQNREATGLCPMEKLALRFDSSQDFYRHLLSKKNKS